MQTPPSSLPTPPRRSVSFHFGDRLAALAAAAAVVAFGLVAAVRSSSRDTGAGGGDERSVVTRAVADTGQVGTQRVVLHVEGMYCASCERTITAMLKRTPGVVRAAVSAERAEAVVVYDPAKTSPAKLVEVVRSLGYTASVQHT